MLLLAHKDSTTSQYQGVWEKFMAFLSRKRLSVSDMSVGVVCNFLHYQASVMGRKYRTLSSYHSALRLPLIYACNIDVKCLTSDLFLRGAYNFRPPVKAKPMPKWSLNMLLRFLSGPLFEPLDSASHLRLTQKTLCLLATGRRISEITNLSRISLRIPLDGSVTSMGPGFCFQTQHPILQTLVFYRYHAVNSVYGLSLVPCPGVHLLG